jgi:hypothetical protein
VPSIVSQPSAALLLQFANPLLHDAIVQLPETQAPAAFGGLQICPQAPQLLTSVLVSVHEPSQLVSPLAQLTMHWPPLHTSVWPQAWAQAPQLLGSLLRSTHAPLQFTWPEGQTRVHVPLTQLCPLEQTFVQLPQ